MQHLLDIFLHLDKHLDQLVLDYGVWVYAILFAIVFAETGLVVAPFLPGDSLLFAAGALAAGGRMNPFLLATLLIIAAVAGNSVNYAVGRWIGHKVVGKSDIPRRGLFRFINQKHIDKAHGFFEKHGGMAIVLGRFVPIVRTCVPFVAGAASMTPARYTLYNVVGAVAWVVIVLGAGYAFGNVPVIKNNFGLVTIGVIVISLLPIAFELLNAKRRANAAPSRQPASPPSANPAEDAA